MKLGGAMFGYSRVKRQRVLLLAVAFVLIQSYVLYASTFHVFHDMMPMCPACVALKSYQGSIVNTTTTVLTSLKFFLEEIKFLPQLNQVVILSYQPRAPPASV